VDLKAISESPLLAALLLFLGGVAIRELWAVLTRQRAREEARRDEWTKKIDSDVANILAAIERATVRQDVTSKELGSLEQQLVAIQVRYDKWAEHWRGEFERFAAKTRDDLQAHRELVHDRQREQSLRIEEALHAKK
jgi:hypothetical protein